MFRVWRSCNLTAFIHSSTGLVVHPFASRHEYPTGVLMWNRDSPVSVVSLHWWPRRDWSLWPHLRRASSRTVTRPLSQKCDNPTWSHIGLLSRFHAYCRASFLFTPDIVSCWGGGEPCGDPAISLQSSTVPLIQWSTHLLPIMRDPGSIPRGVLMWNRDSPVSVSCSKSGFLKNFDDPLKFKDNLKIFLKVQHHISPQRYLNNNKLMQILSGETAPWTVKSD